ncbi:type IV secretory system conjugative DNA transfer family protein [Anatilimnocola floriformis]|uniref:type IV secretory system conjugative DNA transfer family protein n=1 Tax=Anatilimnocola floriformis TaxID=2948575 RepID=UPI0020C201D6|nr:type IV secretory system conjugative DNA transfer family protein [Anatilimnocola floriformis]
MSYRKSILVGRQLSNGEVVTLPGDAHVLTIAPSGVDRLRAAIIPNLLNYEGPAVVVDPTGEAYNATADARRAMGQTVYRLDPCHVVGPESDAINPLDLLFLEGADADVECQTVADFVIPRTSMKECAAFGLLSGVVGYLASVPEKKGFGSVSETFTSDDVIYNLAVVLDTIGKRIPKLAYREIADFLRLPDAERSRILFTVNAKLKPYMPTEIVKALSKPAIPMDELVSGRPFTVYLIIPNDKLRSYSHLLRLWLQTLITCQMRRRNPAASRTLFLLDESAYFPMFPALESAITHSREYGVQVWNFCQDISQFRNMFPQSWPTVLNDSAVQLIRINEQFSTVAEAAALFGEKVETFRALGRDEQMVCQKGVCQKLAALD